MNPDRKYFSFKLYYELPENFNGDMLDALEEFIKYKRGRKTVFHNQLNIPDYIIGDDLATFVYILHKTDLKASFGSYIGKFDIDTNEFLENESNL